MTALTAFVLAIETAGVLLMAKVTALLLVAGLTTLCMKRSSAARRHYVWHLTLTATLALAVFEFRLPTITVRVASDSMFAGAAQLLSRQTPRVTAAPLAVRSFQSTGALDTQIRLPTNFAMRRLPATTDSGAARSLAANANERQESPSRTVIARVLRNVDVKSALVVLWLCGALAIALRLLGAHVRLSSIVRKSRELADRRWHADMEFTMRALQLRRPVRLLVHDWVMGPVTAGWRTPVVLLPPDAGEWPAERRRAVLAHELAHIHRADYLAQLFASLACALYWFHPAVWLAARHLRNEAERSADDSVVLTAMPAVQYAAELLTLAKNAEPLRRDTVVALGIVRASQLEWRLRAMLDNTLSRTIMSVRARRLTHVAALLALMPVAAVQTTVYAAAPAPTLGLATAASTSRLVATASTSMLTPTPVLRLRTLAQDTTRFKRKPIAPARKKVVLPDSTGLPKRKFLIETRPKLGIRPSGDPGMKVTWHDEDTAWGLSSGTLRNAKPLKFRHDTMLPFELIKRQRADSAGFKRAAVPLKIKDGQFREFPSKLSDSLRFKRVHGDSQFMIKFPSHTPGTFKIHLDSLPIKESRSDVLRKTKPPEFGGAFNKSASDSLARFGYKSARIVKDTLGADGRVAGEKLKMVRDSLYFP